MRSRLWREGSLGLLILTGILGLSGLFFWIFNLRPGERGYRFIVRFDNAAGLLDGAAVRLRGVEVGRIQGIMAQLDAVLVEVEIGSSNTLIPIDSEFLSTQTGLIGQTTLDIVPLDEGALDNRAAEASEFAGPIDEQCDSEAIVCEGIEVQGDIGVGYTQLLERVDNLLSTVDAGSFAENLNQVSASVTNVANSVTELSESIQAELDFEAISAAIASMQAAADNLNTVITTTKPSLTASISNLETFSRNAKEISTTLKPLLTDEGFVQNLSTISTNALAASQDLQEITASLNDPDLVLNFRTTLESARVTFENAEKITTDLELLTGDTEFLESLKNLVFGLDGLVTYIPQPDESVRLAGTSRGIQLGFTPVNITSLLDPLPHPQ